LVLFVPAFASGLIAGEKDKKTIDALFTTCLTDGEILWGKLASRLFATLVIIASSLPVIVLPSFLGGFGPKEIIDYALLQLATAVLCAAVGLYYSVISSKPYVALIRAYFVLLVLWLLVPLLANPIHGLWRLGGLPGGTRVAISDFGSIGQMCINPFDLIADSRNFGIFLAIELPILALVVVILASSSIAREADRGSLDPLLLTVLTPHEILMGTVWGVFRTAWPSLALVMVTMVFGGIATLHEQMLVVWGFTLVPMLASLTAGCLLIIASRLCPDGCGGLAN
jgi:ABC-type transport system involved in multi-copper enzyme maturation permease subunit